MKKIFRFGFMVSTIVYIGILVMHLHISLTGIGLFIMGALVSLRAHYYQKNIVTTLFWIVHVVSEIPHVYEGVTSHQWGHLLICLVHLIFDILMMYMMMPKKHFWISLIVVGTSYLLIPIESRVSQDLVSWISPFSIGGLLVCITFFYISYVKGGKKI